MDHGRSVLATAVMMLAAGCSSPTGTDEVMNFSWNLRSNPESVVDTVEAGSSLRVLQIRGRLTSPSRCDYLDGVFGRSGKQLTLRVKAFSGSGANCDSEPGGFQYFASVDGLGRNTYQLRVIHETYEGQEREFNLEVSVVD